MLAKFNNEWKHGKRMSLKKVLSITKDFYYSVKNGGDGVTCKITIP